MNRLSGLRWDVRASGIVVESGVQRVAHPCDHRGICRYRKANGIDGPLFLGIDTHALSEPAFGSAMQVLAANGVEVMIDQDRGYTPTPVISHSILAHNREGARGLADGIVVTPSHNPPEDGGFKYNPPVAAPPARKPRGGFRTRRTG